MSSLPAVHSQPDLRRFHGLDSQRAQLASPTSRSPFPIPPMHTPPNSATAASDPPPPPELCPDSPHDFIDTAQITREHFRLADDLARLHIAAKIDP